ncbi:hypothetical protein EYF80_006930 [Liparis tanakae]|uniref:Uncharacterized protein n=1 Tax=Liparis tanakae TaxID=230148 RepID=A0A4Z2J0J2_9TELE|nr:hypothetical protein EYF80_006930 [Liparis tanakae]
MCVGTVFVEGIGAQRGGDGGRGELLQAAACGDAAVVLGAVRGGSSESLMKMLWPLGWPFSPINPHYPEAAPSKSGKSPGPPHRRGWIDNLRGEKTWGSETEARRDERMGNKESEMTSDAWSTDIAQLTAHIDTRARNTDDIWPAWIQNGDVCTNDANRRSFPQNWCRAAPRRRAEARFPEQKMSG